MKLAFLSLILGTVACQQAAMGGYILAISSKFFDDYKVMFTDTFIDTVQNKTFEHTTNIVPVSMLHLKINSTTGGFKLSNTTFDKENLKFEIQKQKPEINIGMKKLSFDFLFDYNITSDPELISEIGQGSIKVRNLDISGNGSPIKQLSDKSNQYEYLVEINDI